MQARWKNKPWSKRTPREKKIMLIKWSPSKLKCMHACPLKFYYTYIEPVYETTVWIRVLFGIAIHDMCQKLFQRNFKNIDTFLGSWKYQWFRSLLEKYPDEKIRWDSKNPKEERGGLFWCWYKYIETFLGGKHFSQGN
jgi:hypothetical protein